MEERLRIDLEYFVEPYILQFCGPIIFTRSLETATGNVTANGTFGLLDTGGKRLLVTCYHVWEAFQNDLLDDPALHMCICLNRANPIVFSPKEPIGASRELDIATFDMEPFVPVCTANSFYPLHENLVKKLKKGDRLFFVGFPGYSRQVVDEKLGFKRPSIGVSVSSVDRWRFHADIKGLQMNADQFPGVSGAPCFLVREDRLPQLVGFATSVFLGLLGFTHASCLNSDGTLRDPNTLA